MMLPRKVTVDGWNSLYIVSLPTSRWKKSMFAQVISGTFLFTCTVFVSFVALVAVAL